MKGRPRRGDWLAVLDDVGRLVRIAEVVDVEGEEADTFELFPCDGRPLKVRLDQYLRFARPGAERRTWGRVSGGPENPD